MISRAAGVKASSAGFTLVELMIVVVVIGILAAIAYPSYTRYVEKARRADAMATLLDISQRLERCYTQINYYDDEDCGQVFPRLSPDGHYQITVEFELADPTDPTSNATGYTLAANPSPGGAPATTGRQSGDRCGTYTLHHRGGRGSGGAAADRCWQ